jgi:hypothetical protein
MAAESEHWRTNMTSEAKLMTFFAADQHSHTALSEPVKGLELKVVKHLYPSQFNSHQNLFITVPASGLSEVSNVVRQANEKNLLKALFIREDISAEWLPQMLGLADLKMRRNMLVHSNEDWKTPLRVMRAWRMGSQHDLIARAEVSGDVLMLLDCALEPFEIRFDQIPALKKIPEADRKQFTLSDSGSYIHWKSGDVHLDMDAFRYATDESWRKKMDLESLTHNKKFGKAIAQLRKNHQLDKTDIHSVSDRQLRRIENEGARPTIATLTALAEAHNMTLQSYLNEISNQISHY